MKGNQNQKLLELRKTEDNELDILEDDNQVRIARIKEEEAEDRSMDILDELEHIEAQYNVALAVDDQEALENIEVRQEHNPVEHPSHYCIGGIEVWKVISGWHLGYHRGNVMKYLLRCKFTGKLIEDLKKARCYLDDYIKELESDNDPEEPLELPVEGGTKLMR